MKWKAPPIWEGEDVFIIGGGYSLLDVFSIPKTEREPDKAGTYIQPYLEKKRVIGVNRAYELGDWVDCMFFGDCGFYTHHRRELLEWAGLKVSCCPRMANAAHPGIKHLFRDRQKRSGISKQPDRVAWGKNSGAGAINLAYHFGVKRIILLGFDMSTAPDGSTHWHHGHRKGGITRKRANENKPAKRNSDTPLRRFIQTTNEPIAKDAKKLGLEIVYCGTSLLDSFKKVELESVL